MAPKLTEVIEDKSLHEPLSKFESPDALGKAYLEAQQQIGKQGLPLPPEGASPQQVRDFFTKLGCPPEEGGYKTDRFKQPTDIPWDPDFQTELAKLCWHNGITEQQFERLLNGYAGIEKQRWDSVRQQFAEEVEETKGILQKEWGEAYEQNVTMASGLMNALFGPFSDGMRTLKLEDGSTWGSHPVVIKALYEAAKILGTEGGLVSGFAPAVPAFSPAEAQSKIAQIQGDTAFMQKLHDQTAPGHTQAVEEWNRLHKAAYPAR